MQHSSTTLCCFFTFELLAWFEQIDLFLSLVYLYFLMKGEGQSHMFIMYLSSSLCLYNKHNSPLLLQTHMTAVYVFNIYCKIPLLAVMFRLLFLVLRPSILVWLPRCYQALCFLLNLYAALNCHFAVFVCICILLFCLYKSAWLPAQFRGYVPRSWKKMLCV
jgi:hypothetical protein